MKIEEMLRHFASFSFASLDEIAPGTSLVLSPHPDDESLGCGGFIARAVSEGRPPVVVIVSDGSASHPGSVSWPPQRLARCRQEESRNAATVLGLPSDQLLFLGFRDTAVPNEGRGLDDALQQLVGIVRRYDCGTVLVPWRYDPHCDHEAVWVMGQKLKALMPDLRILAYPVWGLTLPPDMEIDEAVPMGWRLDVRDFLDRKRKAVEAHRSQRGLVVEDDPEGFVLPEHLLGKIIQPYEIFIAS